MKPVAQTPLTPFRIPPELKAAAKEKAQLEGRTLSAVVIDLLTQWVKKPARKGGQASTTS